MLLRMMLYLMVTMCHSGVVRVVTAGLVGLCKGLVAVSHSSSKAQHVLYNHYHAQSSSSFRPLICNPRAATQPASNSFQVTHMHKHIAIPTTPKPDNASEPPTRSLQRDTVVAPPTFTRISIYPTGNTTASSHITHRKRTYLYVTSPHFLPPCHQKTTSSSELTFRSRSNSSNQRLHNRYSQSTPTWQGESGRRNRPHLATPASQGVQRTISPLTGLQESPLCLRGRHSLSAQPTST